MYEGLTTWDLSSADKASVVIPGIATEWSVSPADKTKWIFKLRPGVKFHDGSDFRCRCGGVERREGAEAGRAAFRREPGRRHRLAHAEPAQRHGDRQDDGRADDGGARCAAADQSHQPLHGLARAVEEALRRGAGERRRSEGTRQAGVGRVRAQCIGHRPVEDGPVRPARAARAGQERRLLGHQARAEGRSAGAAADARGERAHRGAAFRPGRLDREPGARRAAADQAARLYALPERAAACLAVAVQPDRGLALERSARAQGRQPVCRPQCHEGRPARRPDGGGDRHVRAGPSVARKSEVPDQA